MGLTLIVEDHIQLQDFYHLNLYTWVGCDVIRASNAKFAGEILEKKGQQIDLILTRFSIKTEQTFDALINNLAQLNLKIPIVSLGVENLAENNVTYLRSGINIRDIVKACAGYLGVTAQSMSKLEVDDFFPVPIQLFHHLEIAVCDIYDFEQNKILNSDQLIDTAQLKNDIASGMGYYYVKKDKRLKFVSNYNEVMASQMNLLELNKDEQVQASELCHNLTRENLRKFGMTEETVKLANKNLKDMIQTSKQSRSLLRFIKRLVQNKAGFHFKHTQILMYISAHLMDELDWGTEEQKAKIQFIAFFHDIALENDIQARIHSNEQLKNSNLPLIKKELVKKHAMLAATLVSQYPNAPMGVEQIIKQHHGALNGVGFSDHYSQNISPLAIVHILAEDFATHILEDGVQFDHKKIIKEMRDKYSTQRFKKIIDSLQTIAI